MDELQKIVTETCEAINKANTAVRQLLKDKHGITTAADLFHLIENKAVTEELMDAETLAWQAEKVDIIFGQHRGIIH
jgi:hypothetical protein